MLATGYRPGIDNDPATLGVRSIGVRSIGDGAILLVDLVGHVGAERPHVSTADLDYLQHSVTLGEQAERMGHNLAPNVETLLAQLFPTGIRLTPIKGD